MEEEIQLQMTNERQENVSIENGDKTPEKSPEKAPEENGEINEESTPAKKRKIQGRKLTVEGKLRNAALNSRFPAALMTRLEEDLFPHYIEKKNLYIYYRNKILSEWLDNPKKYITYQDVLKGVFPQSIPLVTDIYNFLTRHGFINFGVLEKKGEPIIKEEKTIVVVGAGMGGLACARQLVSFGFKVIVLEAKNRVGGRVYSPNLGKDRNIFQPGGVDMGASIITGLIGGNPLAVLTNQLGVELYPLNPTCNLYEPDGSSLEKELDAEVETIFNNLMEETHRLRQGEFMKKEIQGILNSMAERNGTIIENGNNNGNNNLNKSDSGNGNGNGKGKEKLEEVTDLNVSPETPKKIEQLIIEKRDVNIEPMEICNNNNNTSSESATSSSNVQSLEIEGNDQSLGDALEKCKKISYPSLSPKHETVLGWHCANLEFANSNCLDKISLLHWDQDDGFEFTGNHLMIHGGYGQIAHAMQKDLDIRLEHVVQKIDYQKDSITVGIENGETIECDAVVVTCPLGVLQRKLIDFNPPLPLWKQQSIDRMGFGVMNKVGLLFPEVFWDNETDMFGSISESKHLRGKFFLFLNLYPILKTPSIVVLSSGSAAEYLESLTDEELIQSVVTILKNIFGENKVPQPIDYAISRWKEDKFCGGSYSSLPPNSSGEDYDSLAKSIDDKVYFGGEATNRNYPATVHGAILSGLREASKILDKFSKPTYHPPQPTKTVKFEEEIVCEWNGCGEKIPTEISLQDHIINSHFSLFEKQLYYHEVAAQKNYKPINPNKSFSFYSHSPPKTPSRRAPPPPLNFMTSPIGTTPIKKTLTPLDLSNFEGAEELNEKEKDLCSTGRIPPRTFLTMKQIIINAAQKNGSNIISKSQARLLCNIDVNKTSKIYDYLVEENFVQKPPTENRFGRKYQKVDHNNEEEEQSQQESQQEQQEESQQELSQEQSQQESQQQHVQKDQEQQ